jgi:hypothetical protein
MVESVISDNRLNSESKRETTAWLGVIDSMEMKVREPEIRKEHS